MLMSRRYKTIISAIAAVGIVGAGTTWAATDGGDAGAAPSDAALGLATATTAVSDVQPNIRSNFALFRDHPASPLPDDVAAQVGSPVRFGRNPNLARVIQTVTGTGWVIPGDGYLCIVVPDPVDGYGTACEPTGAAVKQGLIISMWGNLPNGKVAETLLTADGQHSVAGTDTVAVDDGVASVFTDTPGTLHPAP